VSLPPEVPQPVNRPNTQPATTDDEVQNVEREMTGFERATLRWAKVAVFLSALAALFVCLQWYEMHQGGIDTHALAEATKDAAGAASDQADAAQQFSDTAEDINGRMQDAVDQLQAAAENAKSSIRATQDAMRLDQRAWVILRGIEGDLKFNQPWLLSVYFTNTGRTPAKNVRLFCRAVPVVSETEVDFTWSASGTEHPTLIAPNDANSFCGLTPLTIPTVTQEVLDIFSTRKKIEVVYGTVVYDDIFRKQHWLTFCRSMHPDGKEWDACASHNDTGDGKPSK
jgi:hypothetical protein